jgi:MOSC domain-containing protein YiiM
MQSNIISLQVGLPKTIKDPAGDWVSGIWKDAVDGPVSASKNGLAGDGQGDLAVHGGPDKAIYVYPVLHYEPWRNELGLAELTYGGFGENLTISDWNEDMVCIGDVLQIGDQVVVQVSQPRGPCWKLSRRLEVKDMVALVVKTGRTGWYLRVLQAGDLAAGMPIKMIERPYPQLTITAANQAMWHTKDQQENIEQLVECPALAESWRKGLQYRLGKLKEE